MLGSLAADALQAEAAAPAPALTVPAGGCSATPLPLDASAASVARRLFRDAATGIGLPAELVHDGVTMASELAANTLHAQENIEFDSGPACPVAGVPELWLYLRRVGGEQELVCKVFDSLPSWKLGAPPDPAGLSQQARVRMHSRGSLAAESGRGLRVVAGLSGGRWGHHLTRARLGGWKVAGKAIWFAVPVSATSALDRFRLPQPGSCQAASALEQMLAGRGLGGRIVRADAPNAGMSVLSIRRDLTVWCRSRVVSWTTRAGRREWRAFSDLEDAAEQIVCTYEELARVDDGGLGGLR